MARPTLRQFLTDDLRRHGGLLCDDGLYAFSSSDGSVLLESARPDGEGENTYLFLDPVDIIRARRIGEVVPALVRAQMMLEQGHAVAGFVAYEAGPAFLPAPQREPDDAAELLWLGVYDRPIVVPRDPAAAVPFPESGEMSIGEVHPEMTEKAYASRLRAIRRYLEAGHTYQVNFTFPVSGRWDGTDDELYARLRYNQPVPFSAFLRLGPVSLLSFSPELFFRVDGSRLTMRPMKGTARRGMTTAEDRHVREMLALSDKDRAENRMIVDLIRNDVGRIARPGTVSVRSFFDVVQYPTVYQATSTVTARLAARPALVDLFGALFPSGSVTGAPKVETMRIIDELEPTPRGVYTGAVGYALPDGHSVFNVAIRTVEADEEEGTFVMHTGSGVTIGSDPRSEYAECLQKARFLTRQPLLFDLLETILWTPSKGYWLLRDHLTRLKDSSAYFGRPFDPTAVRRSLEECAAGLRGTGSPHRVRLLVDDQGQCRAEAATLRPIEEPVRVGISKKTVSTDDLFQYHKTTNREVYDLLLEEAGARGWYDAIVLNERGEVAEGARSNVFIEQRGVLYTPPVASGILAGVARRWVMRSKDHVVQERTLTRDDLVRSDAVYISNAVRGLVRAVLVR